MDVEKIWKIAWNANIIVQSKQVLKFSVVSLLSGFIVCKIHRPSGEVSFHSSLSLRQSCEVWRGLEELCFPFPYRFVSMGIWSSTQRGCQQSGRSQFKVHAVGAVFPFHSFLPPSSTLLLCHQWASVKGCLFLYTQQQQSSKGRLLTYCFLVTESLMWGWACTLPWMKMKTCKVLLTSSDDV